MIGIILAAGAGRRLLPLTADLPKTLLPVDGDLTLLDLALENLRAGGVTEAVVVTGHAAERIERERARLERRYELSLRTLFNPEALKRNNAYSLWLASEEFGRGALLVNGDTLCPSSVVEALRRAYDSEPRPDIALAVDDRKVLGDEEMKVRVDGCRSVVAVSKRLDPATAYGEYIGVAVIHPGAAPALTASLETAWRTDPSHYYEDGFQTLIDRGGRITAVPVGDIDWIEVDDQEDLARARALRCPS